MDQIASVIYTGPEPGSPEQVEAIIEELRCLYPGAKCTLNFSNPLELLIATQLGSKQCTSRSQKKPEGQKKQYLRGSEAERCLARLCIHWATHLFVSLSSMDSNASKSISCSILIANPSCGVVRRILPQSRTASLMSCRMAAAVGCPKLRRRIR